MRFGQVVLALVVMVGVGCRRGAESPASPREVTIFAAASLREVCEAIDARFEAAHPGVRVRLNLAGSQELRLQIEQGARADLFASADAKNMTALAEKELVAPARTFAHNEPVVVVGAGTVPRVTAFSDLPDVGRLVIGTPEVPIGRYTVQILERANRRFGSDLPRPRAREGGLARAERSPGAGEGDAG